MKKLIIVAAAAAACFAGFGQRTPAELVNQYNQAGTNKAMRAAFKRSITLQEAVNVYDYIIDVARTNYQDAAKTFYGFDVIDIIAKDAAVATEYDAKLAAAGLYVCITRYNVFPLLAEAWLSKYPIISSNMPATVAAVRSHKTFQTERWLMPELVNSYAEIMAANYTNPVRMSTYLMRYKDRIKTAILRRAPEAIKRGLRERGRTFVTKKGEPNPVQPALDALTAALNAPRMAGVETWVAEWYPEYEWKAPIWASDEFINSLKDNIYYGKIDLNAINRRILLGCLGVDAYNAFIADYNGEAAK